MTSKTENIVVLNSGIKVPLDKNVMSDKIIDRLRANHYERDESLLLPTIIQDGETVLEIGGGIGYISALVAKNPKVEAVYTYEANPDLIKVIKKTHDINNLKCKILNGVLLPNTGGRVKNIDFYIRSDFWASSLSPEPWAYTKIVKVPVFDFEEVISELNPTLLIIDIEGGELEIFKDVKLKGVNKIFIELHPAVIGQHGKKEVYNTLSILGFNIDQQHTRGNVVLFRRYNHKSIRLKSIKVYIKKKLKKFNLLY